MIKARSFCFVPVDERAQAELDYYQTLPPPSRRFIAQRKARLDPEGTWWIEQVMLCFIVPFHGVAALSGFCIESSAMEGRRSTIFLRPVRVKSPDAGTAPYDGCGIVREGVSSTLFSLTLSMTKVTHDKEKKREPIA